MASSVINLTLEIDRLRQAANQLKWANPVGLLWNKCPKCGGKVHPVGTGLIREKCSNCGAFYSDRRIA